MTNEFLLRASYIDFHEKYMTIEVLEHLFYEYFIIFLYIAIKKFKFNDNTN